ncbi:protein-export chaperone SecB [Temperatibacter marinus]|uniref:Protein-export protein SecB n=1 Tax=Temperatibacter marinus TaxID=1456591 RepID=A0AA52EJ13_9PROT|nr:protein-export chaperone SecB [Temperatibacter marinus]WND03700.1 protein-export chaperone SecB [Temperatibacter marinus]
MAEENNQGNAPVGGEENTGPTAGMITQYIKDLSFENPNAPQSLQNNSGQNPAIDVNVNVGVTQINDEVYEVELKISASSKVENDTVAFVVELAYGGLFGLRGIPEDATKAFLLIQAPTMMFPFARQIIATATQDGGYPPLMLDPINFEALFRQQQAQAEAQAADANASAPAGDADVTVN